jgi:hypothetical protein
MGKVIEIAYTNWVDDEVVIKLRSLREVASFEEVMGLRELEHVDEGKVFEHTITFFKRAFFDEVERKAFFMEPMETVLDVLDEWLILSYKGNRNLGEELDTDDEGLEVSFDFTFIDEDEQVKSFTASVFTNIGIIVFLVIAIVFNWWWMIWGVVSVVALNTILISVMLIKLLKSRKEI